MKSQQKLYMVKVVCWRTLMLRMSNLAGDHDNHEYRLYDDVHNYACSFLTCERLKTSELNIYYSFVLKTPFSDYSIRRLSVKHHLSGKYFFSSFPILAHTNRVHLGKECVVTLNQLSGLKVKVKLDICLKSLTGIFSPLVSYFIHREASDKECAVNLNRVSRSKFGVLSES